MNEPSVPSWGPTSKATRSPGRWRKAGVGLLAAMLASPGVWAQSGPSVAPTAPTPAVPPPVVPPSAVPSAEGTASTPTPNQPQASSAEEQIRALREDLARQSAELSAQRAE